MSHVTYLVQIDNNVKLHANDIRLCEEPNPDMTKVSGPEVSVDVRAAPVQANLDDNKMCTPEKQTREVVNLSSKITGNTGTTQITRSCRVIKPPIKLNM
ncbi:hypothetical protein QE152_g40213 [Popillia japonica]|uniref:Uncharacterized protein n=1 Tax=Popillia japonica TaxID=7064 RepID=A0AAW1HRX9_POPJA